MNMHIENFFLSKRQKLNQFKRYHALLESRPENKEFIWGDENLNWKYISKLIIGNWLVPSIKENQTFKLNLLTLKLKKSSNENNAQDTDLQTKRLDVIT